MSANSNKARENSVKNLQTLYSVVIGLSLTQAIRTVVGADPNQVKVEALPFFLAYLFILIPFYHGALRHLDATYVEGPSSGIKSGALMADFLLLFLEGIVFLALSMVLTAPNFFAWGAAVLLLLDSFWGFMAHLAFADRNQDHRGKWSPEAKWATLNVTTSTVLVIYLIFGRLLDEMSPHYFGVGIAFICFLRTILDYIMTWDFYFPPIETERHR